MKRKDFVALEKLGVGSLRFPACRSLSKKSALLFMRLSLLNKLEKPRIFRKQR
jgi:hypothetical protein